MAKRCMARSLNPEYPNSRLPSLSQKRRGRPSFWPRINARFKQITDVLSVLFCPHSSEFFLGLQDNCGKSNHEGRIHDYGNQSERLCTGVGNCDNECKNDQRRHGGNCCSLFPTMVFWVRGSVMVGEAFWPTVN